MTGLPPDKPVSFIRSTGVKLRRFAIYWTRPHAERPEEMITDQIWTVMALDEVSALETAAKASGRSDVLTAKEVQR